MPNTNDGKAGSPPDAAGDDGEGHAEEGVTSRWEWVAATLGAIVVLVALGIMIRAAMMTRADPFPQITVQVDTVITSGAGHLVRVRIINAGGAPAVRVTVEGTLMADTIAVERSETGVDHLPPRSTRTAGLLFTRPPREYRLELRAVGYDTP